MVVGFIWLEVAVQQCMAVLFAITSHSVTVVVYFWMTITVYNSVDSEYVREATDRLNTKIQEQQKEKEIEIDETKEPELTDEEIDRMIRELERKKRRKEKDFEM